MEYKIVIRPEMKVIGVELRTTNAGEQAMKMIPAFWAKHRDENTIAKIPNKVDPNVVVGIYTDYNSDGYFSLFIGSPVKNFDVIPPFMAAIDIFEGKYAEFTAKGPYSPAITHAWQHIWESDIIRAYKADFEWYDERSTDDENSIVRIYVSIKD
jgi:predicted transcriptional regulator YdeE